jgi:hypothetical protein
MGNSLESLRSSFLQKAQNAPKLFRDLAKVEQYIADSYKTRAFIELIQNADDAQAGRFGIHEIPLGFAAGNDGRPFTYDDLEALCRSGASHKQRGGNTIGYRGIGFKSVVNLAKTVFVFSGGYAFFFNKNTTKSLFTDVPDVPLIRIPHPLPLSGNEGLFAAVARLRERLQYKTVFIFQELNERLSSEEFAVFDRSALLFLHNIRLVEFGFHGSNRKIAVEITGDSDGNEVATLSENGGHDVWNIVRSPRDPTNMLALKTAEGSIVPALPEESVFHSFTPTTEFAGAYVKINGDYSTDPSRQSLDMDECSTKSLADLVELLADTVVSILNGKSSKPGFFTPFVNVKPSAPNRSSPKLLPSLAEHLHGMTLRDSWGRTVPFTSLRLRPDWLNYDDYEQICCRHISSIGKGLLAIYPELPAFLGRMNVPTLLIPDVMDHLNERPVSPLGNAQIFIRLVKQYRYDLHESRVQQIKQLKVFPVRDGVVTAVNVKATSALNRDFLQFVADNADGPDLKMVFGKLGIALNSSFQEKPSPQPSSPQERGQRDGSLPPFFKTQPALKQWRSAEHNAAEYIRALNGVVAVNDMSVANVGYDLEVTLQSQRKVFVEVKSVTAFSDPFRLTNNEYSSAHQYGDDYFVALVINGDPFQIRVIRNPVASLALHKQCERWSWYCEDYSTTLAAINEITDSAR